MPRATLGSHMLKITPCLWFDHQAEEATKFYVTLFKGSRVMSAARYDEAGSKASGMPTGSVMTVAFKLFGQDFLALNGGPVFKFSPAISFIVNCENQAEVDRYWKALSKGGEPNQCGWLTDRYGVSWQIVPTILDRLLTDKNPGTREKAMAAMLKMKKISVAKLLSAVRTG